MRNLLILILLLSSNLYGVEINTRWNDFFQKEVTVTCSEDHAFCEEVCNDKYFCVVKETPCRNCLGTSVQMHHIFKNMGKVFVAKEEVTSYEIRDLLSSKNFVTVTSKSVFNNVTRFNNSELRRQFMTLCPEKRIKYPIVFFDRDEVTNRLGDVRFVACQKPDGELSVYKMEDDGNLEIFVEEDEESEIDEFLFM